MTTKNLTDRLPDDGASLTADEAFDRFLEWVGDTGVSLYDHQEEAVMALMAGQHVILKTPTGSGKSLVATAMHWHGLAVGDRSVYTSPIKALVSEKFFALCRDFGPLNVGMMTGDATVNRDAPILCCTAEVLASMALREGPALDVQHVVMDEFHYYGDKDRGMAWQIPLLCLPQTTFLLMSATLGDTAPIVSDLEAFTKRPCTVVESAKRPVPLDFQYKPQTLQEAVQGLLGSGKAPIYIVSFSQREAAEEAQNLTSLAVVDKEGRAAIAEALGGFRFDSPYGKDVQRFVRHGIGIHHAGLLPKYRLLVEKLAQRGLLKVVSGTDTLGVGVNVPIRTVVFTRLCKYDGEKTRILTVRDFHQISGRAGRKGFDDRGWVVCLAPEHVVENMKSEAKADGKKYKKKAPPDKHWLPWDEKTFDTLQTSAPEALESVFRIDHATILSLMKAHDARAAAAAEAEESGSATIGWSRHGGYGDVIKLIARSHERPGRKTRLRREARGLFQTLVKAGVVEVETLGSREERILGQSRGRRVHLSASLQDDFSLNQTLSLFLLFALHRLDPEAPTYALDVLTRVESILDSPRGILERQADKAKRALLEELKAEGIPYEERVERIAEITWPKPDAEAIYQSFDLFVERHPWAAGEPVRVKSIAREMLEQFLSFNDMVKEYGLERMEGVLLRYLSDVYKTLTKTVPPELITSDLTEVIETLRAEVGRADSSLVSEWEDLRAGKGPAMAEAPGITAPTTAVDLARDKKALAARVRADVHALLRALSRGDTEEAASIVHPEGPLASPEAFQDVLRGFRADLGDVRADHEARLPDKTRLHRVDDHHWEVAHTLLGTRPPERYDSGRDEDEGDAVVDEPGWTLEAEIDLTLTTRDAPLLRVIRIAA